MALLLHQVEDEGERAEKHRQPDEEGKGPQRYGLLHAERGIGEYAVDAQQCQVDAAHRPAAVDIGGGVVPFTVREIAAGLHEQSGTVVREVHHLLHEVCPLRGLLSGVDGYLERGRLVRAE